METQEPAVSEEQAPEATQRDMRDLATGALVSFAGKLGRAFRGAFMWLVPILFSMEILGLYYTAWGLVSTLNKIGRFGLQRGVVRFVVAARAAGDQAGVDRALAAAAGIGLLLSTAVTLVTMLSAEWVAGFYDKPLAPAIRVMALTTPFMALASVFVAATRALRIMRYDVYVVSIAGPVILLILGGVAGLLGLGLEGIAAAQLAMAVGCCALAAIFFRRFFSLSGCFRRLGRGLPWRPLARFSFPVMVSDLLYALLTQLDALMLALFVSPELVGLYGLARRVASAMLKAPHAFDPMFSSIVSELSHHRQHLELGHCFVVTARWILTINLPIFGSILILGGHLLRMLDQGGLLARTGADVGTAVQILFLLCIGMMIQAVFAMAGPLLSMAGRPYLNLQNNSVWLGVNFLLTLWLVRSHGIVGAAIAATAAMILVNVIRLTQVYVVHGVLPFRLSLLKPLAAAAGGALAGWLVREQAVDGSLWAMCSSGLAFLGVYAGLLHVLGLDPEDRALLARSARRARHYLTQRLNHDG